MFIFGVAAGIFTVFIISYLIIRLIRKATHQKGLIGKFDERQQAAQGKAYKYAFLTMVILNAVTLYWFSPDTVSEHPERMPIFLWGILIISLLVLASYSIWNNAYIGINETYRSSLVLIGLIGGVNLAIGIIDLKSVEFSNSWINLGLGAAMIIVFIEMVIKNMYDKQNDSGDEE